MEKVEQITRNVLNVRTIKRSENLHSAVVDEVLKDDHILELWDANAMLIPAKYEAYSLELLKAVVELYGLQCAASALQQAVTSSCRKFLLKNKEQEEC